MFTRTGRRRRESHTRECLRGGFFSNSLLPSGGSVRSPYFCDNEIKSAVKGEGDARGRPSAAALAALVAYKIYWVLD